MRLRILTLAAFLTFLAGCAGTREAATPPNPIVGTWAYSVDTPQGIYRGDLVIQETDAGLTGVIKASNQPGETALRDLAFDGRTVTFVFNNPEAGLVRANIDLADDALEGLLIAPAYSLEMPVTATRTTME